MLKSIIITRKISPLCIADIIHRGFFVNFRSIKNPDRSKRTVGILIIYLIFQELNNSLFGGCLHNSSLADGGTKDEENYYGHYDCNGQADPDIADKTCDNEVNKTDQRYGYSVRQLCTDMVDVVDICTCGSHDRGVGDR